MFCMCMPTHLYLEIFRIVKLMYYERAIGTLFDYICHGSEC